MRTVTSKPVLEVRHLDLIGRELKVGDHVVFYNNVYRILSFRGKHEAVIFLSNPSPTTKKKTCLTKHLALLPEGDVLFWLIKK